MFFFIGGIQPKTLLLDDEPGICSSCGLSGARVKRVDHYFSLFFIPLFPVRRGEPFLECSNCGVVSQGRTDGSPRAKQDRSDRCPHCKRTIEPTFQYCPFCGRPIH